jgi:multicomponent Na+:H+ antiporter subunit F
MSIAVQAAELGIVAVSAVTLVSTYRFFQGPTIPDRMVALDTITTTIVAIGALQSIATGKSFYLMISLVLGIIGFISTVTVSKFIEDGDIIV